MLRHDIRLPYYCCPCLLGATGPEEVIRRVNSALQPAKPTVQQAGRLLDRFCKLPDLVSYLLQPLDEEAIGRLSLPLPHVSVLEVLMVHPPHPKRVILPLDVP